MGIFNNNQRQPQTAKTNNSQTNTPVNNSKQQTSSNTSNSVSNNQRGFSLFGARNTNNTNPTQTKNANTNPVNQNNRKANNASSNLNNNTTTNNNNNKRTSAINQNNTKPNTYNQNQNQNNAKGNNRQQTQPSTPASSNTQQNVQQIIKNIVNTKQYTNTPATNYTHPVQSSPQTNKMGGTTNMQHNSSSSTQTSKSSVFDNPVFKDIDPAKMSFIKDMVTEMDGKKQEAKSQLLMTYIMRMRQEGFSFTPEELTAVTAALRPTMSDEENKQFDAFTALMRNMYR